MYYLKAKLELQRVSSIIKTGVNHLYNESLEGVTTIRVFQKTDDTMTTFYGKINTNRSARLIKYGTESWLDIRFRVLSL